MSFLEAALTLAKKGFHVFPLIPNSKLPAKEGRDFPNRATTDEKQIKRWWMVNPNFNIGISTSKFGEDGALLVVDVDNKNEKNGVKEAELLAANGFKFGSTFEQQTPTGGFHFVYKVKTPVKQGSNVLAPGLDIRSKGGYIVGAGSKINGKKYFVVRDLELEFAPGWIIEKCGEAPEKKTTPHLTVVESIDQKRALKQAIHYLKHEAPLSIQGASGDQTAFIVACRVKDFGVSKFNCFEAMADHWNERCQPPWDLTELEKKIENAYSYGQEPVGVAAPENDFKAEIPDDKKKHFIKTLNEEFAVVTLSGSLNILWETLDEHSNKSIRYLTVQSFHQLLAPKKVQLDSGIKQQSVLWMHSPERRQYAGVCFSPGKEPPPRYYNIWQGFSVEPFKEHEKPSPLALKAFAMFKDHALKNVCGGDSNLMNWLMGYFAHLVQKPWEKPLTALVFRGNKGVGKNALINCVGKMLGSSFTVTSDKRYLTGNFNSHLENLLLFTLDEAFWSGDKQAEGVLKNLITGDHHLIERKGKEPYTVKNCTRVVIIGNEDWLVPASSDERRFAVFEVGEGNKQDTSFFETMRKGMEAGGSRLLFQYFKEFDLSEVNVNVAPQTEALLEQKLSSLNPIEQYLYDCLNEGRLLYSEFNGHWVEKMSKDSFRSAFQRYMKERNIGSRVPSDVHFGRLLKRCIPALDANQKIQDGDNRVGAYQFPPLEDCRQSWDQHMGQKGKWGMH